MWANENALAHPEGIFPSFGCGNQLEFRNGLIDGAFKFAD